ncbi:acyltransferase domain-containing protein [Streptomyces griseus]|uniref:acyltransferase domain-containing protein n=1 Tax=Streptomyces griseus TaxID=1911 RepID=UPI00056334A4|nr:acyltransferase domain-containing protein [Streptomyces griseus]
MTDCAVLFPGQGAYLPGALAALAEDEPLVRETLGTLDAAAVRLGRTAPSRLLLDERAPSAADLAATAPADLHTALFASEIALFRILTERHGLRPRVLLGHSFGELVALTAAGAYGPEEGLALVAARDDAFAARPPEPGGMVALGISAARTAGLLNGLGEWEVTLAADNGPRQCVVSGPSEPLERVRAAAGALGIGATRLRVPYAFHHRSLAAVAGDFAHRAAALRTRPVRHLLHSAILGRRLEDADAVADLVAAHLVRPTLFTDAVRELHADGVDVFVECGPRGVLSDLVAATVPGVRVIAPLRRRAGGREVADALGGVAGGAARAAGTSGGTSASEGTGASGGTSASGRTRASGDTRASGGTGGTGTRGSAPAAPPAGPGGLDPREVLATLRALYAEALGYPPEVLTGDADLEADLGVDSIKQTELFARAVTRYGRALPAEGSRLTSHTTLDALAGLLNTLPAAGTAGAAA